MELAPCWFFQMRGWFPLLRKVITSICTYVYRHTRVRALTHTYIEVLHTYVYNYNSSLGIARFCFGYMPAHSKITVTLSNLTLSDIPPSDSNNFIHINHHHDILKHICCPKHIHLNQMYKVRHHTLGESLLEGNVIRNVTVILKLFIYKKAALGQGECAVCSSTIKRRV